MNHELSVRLRRLFGNSRSMMVREESFLRLFMWNIFASWKSFTFYFQKQFELFKTVWTLNSSKPFALNSKAICLLLKKFTLIKFTHDRLCNRVVWQLHWILPKALHFNKTPTVSMTLNFSRQHKETFWFKQWCKHVKGFLLDVHKRFQKRSTTKLFAMAVVSFVKLTLSLELKKSFIKFRLSLLI